MAVLKTNQEVALYSSLICFNLLSALMIVSYNPSHSSTAPQPSKHESAIFSHGVVKFLTRPLPVEIELLKDPSPVLFLIAISTFTLASLAFHHLNAANPLQNPFLLMGTGCAMIFSGVRSLLDMRAAIVINLTKSLVISTVASSLVSATALSAMEWWYSSGRNVEGPEQVVEEGQCGDLDSKRNPTK